jgi:flagellar protein FliL
MADMAEQTAQAEAAPAEPSAPAKKGRMMMIGLIVGGIVLGGGTGAFLVAPRLAPKAVAAEPAATAETAAKPVEAGKIVRLDNMIVNPAGSQGTRFLMVSVAYEVSNAEAEKLLHDREVQLRDEVMAVLAQQPLDSLVQATSRDRVKEKLAAIVRPMLPKDAPLQVYLPQFVIQ